MAAVIPAWNRPADLVRIMTDLAAIDCDADIRVIVVDNNSDVALEPLEAVAAATRSLHEHHAV
ncbi:MAG: glycosyltransferase, partial [Planctomycetota bacterium]